MTDTKKYRKPILIIIIVLVVLAVGVSLISMNIVNTAMKHGETAYDQYENDLAITNYTKAIKFCFLYKEKKAISFLYRGRSYYEKEEYNQALADFTAAIDLQKDYYPYYTWRARTYHNLGNYELAIKDFNKSIAIQYWEGGNIWNTYLERASLYSENKEYDLEIADYEEAIIALDKRINSSHISDDEIDELNKKRDDIINRKISAEKDIEWRKNNPNSKMTRLQWELIEWLGLNK